MINKILKKRIHVATVLFLIFVFACPGLASAKIINPEAASKKVVSLVNKYFDQDKDAEAAGKPVEESGLYKVNISQQNRTEAFYLTKDGALLIFSKGMMDIAKFEEAAKNRQKTQKEQIPQAKKPVVELYVMSLCPYGIRAEKDIWPVMTSFGEKIDFKLKFIVTVKGKTLRDVDSLHGYDEAREDARQAAILHYYPEKFSAYIEKINESACVISCGAVKLEDYWKKSAEGLGMDSSKIESFAYGQEGMDFLRQNEADAARYGVSGSPTLIINGVASSSVYQGAEATQRAICSSFSSVPNECQKGAEAGS